MSFEIWDAGRLAGAAPVVAVPRCTLIVGGQPWMFDSDECINGLAHGTGTAVRLDGGAYIQSGRFLLGRHVGGALRSLALGGAD